MRMEQHRIHKNILERRPVSRRSKGRSGKRWIEDVEKELRSMGRRLCSERAEWRKIVEKATTHTRL